MDEREEGAQIARFGIPPAASDLPEIRARLATETRLEVDEDDASDTLIMKELCVLLFAAGQVEDALRIWEAKRASFDAGCGIDVQLLCGAGVEATCRYLAMVDTEASRAALAYLRECEVGGDLDHLPGMLEAYRRYYGVAG